MCSEFEDGCLRNVEEAQSVCPTSSDNYLIALFSSFGVLTILLVVQHLLELKHFGVPQNDGGPLEDFNHFSRADKRLVQKFEGEGILYAGYQEKADKHQSFFHIFAMVSGAVAFGVMYARFTSFYTYLLVAVWWVTCFMCIFIKTFRKPTIYLLTRERAVIIFRKCLMLCDTREQSYLLSEMPFVCLHTWRGGSGSVYFQTKERPGVAETPSPDSPYRFGFDFVARAEQVHDILVGARAAKLGTEVGQTVRTNQQPMTWFERIQLFLALCVVVIFIVVFGSVVYSRRNKTLYWYGWVIVAYAAFWLIAGIAYFVYRIRLWRMRRSGFVPLSEGLGTPMGGMELESMAEDTNTHRSASDEGELALEFDDEPRR